ncbi:BTB/POZ domain-containing protein POB1 [Acorus gramineus]|uniref:BTB/POZ domain-containing protein POB1 n=1 Tax=Acorus gramineus TaxID=55184 RepID=A0AAV9BEJ9_ACOGR|nr:BTB/POZ domain-containing protein POB1 [Acorus gramineus]
MDNEGHDQISFEFAFNNPTFSDRILRIDITDGPLEDKQISSSEKSKKRLIHGKEIKEEPEDEVEARVECMHINITILAAKSTFFYKLFSNGMRDSNNKCEITVKIKASQEAALKELLYFIYSGKFSSTDASDHHSLLGILVLAEKYEVVMCIRYCVQLLLKLPVTQESALLYLELPSSVSTNMEVQPLMSASKKHLVSHFRDIEESRDELMNLSITGLERIRSVELIIQWAGLHYPNVQERQEALGSLITRFVRFPYMSCAYLRHFLAFIDRTTFVESIIDALLFKDESLQIKRAITSSNSTNKQFIERSYKFRPIKVVELLTSKPHSIIYFSLSRSECTSLFPSGVIRTQSFPVGGHMFYLSEDCRENKERESHSFGLYLSSPEKVSVSFHCAVRKNPD